MKKPVDKEKLKGFENLASKDYLRLLRGIALGGRAADDVQILLEKGIPRGTDFQAMALKVAGQSLEERRARRVFEALRIHGRDLKKRLGRAVGLRTAALDLAEGLEAAFGVEGEEGALSYTELTALAFTDPLTGLNNYRYFSMRFHEEIQRAERYRHPMSFILLDLDHFKAFNDAHGHPAGNEALIQVGRLLASECRDTDLVARYGGEEFAFTLPETTKHMAQELAERVCRRIESTPIQLGSGERHRVTASLGLATFPRDSYNGESLIEGADAALYRAKGRGRNRVAAFAPDSHADFQFRPKVPGVQRVSVVANFNGWDARADTMSPRANGIWHARVAVVPGTYEYKFVVNGEQWFKDPACGESVGDGYWGENSIVRVTRKSPDGRKG